MRVGSGAGCGGPDGLCNWHHQAAAARPGAWHAHGEAYVACTLWRVQGACRRSQAFRTAGRPQEMLSIAQRLGPEVHTAIGRVLAEAMAQG